MYNAYVLRTIWSCKQEKAEFVMNVLPGLNRVLEVECTYPHVYVLCLALVRDRTAPSLHYSLFELLEISHLNSIGKDLFDLLHVS